jgi:hypothetical protein
MPLAVIFYEFKTVLKSLSIFKLALKNGINIFKKVWCLFLTLASKGQLKTVLKRNY